MPFSYLIDAKGKCCCEYHSSLVISNGDFSTEWIETVQFITRDVHQNCRSFLMGSQLVGQLAPIVVF